MESKFPSKNKELYDYLIMDSSLVLKEMNNVFSVFVDTTQNVKE